jgi:chromate reductase, NAD(P)H dehydrogenase (quinone)
LKAQNSFKRLTIIIKQNNNIIMITIVSGTNRKDNNTKKVALAYQKLLAEKKIESKVLALDEHNVYERDEAFVIMENDYLKNAEKIIFVLPEYNGSFPGVLKMLIDNSDVKTAWPNKKALLVGVASGRAGNLRGLEHLTGSLMHIKMIVHPNRLPISSIHNLLNVNGEITDASTLKTIDAQLDEFINF